LGVPALTDRLGLPAAQRYVVFMVDGLGWEPLLGVLSELPHLADLMDTAQQIDTVIPSTTAAALVSFGTGLPPGQHGFIGYRFWDPELAKYVAPLNWDPHRQPDYYQPQPTILERIGRTDASVTAVIPPDQVTSGFSRAALRGAQPIGVANDDLAEWVHQVVAATQLSPRSLVYTYDFRLDQAGHGYGVASQEWLDQARQLDHRVGLLRAGLGSDTVLLITGDHGMVDVPPQRHCRIEQTPELAAGLDRVAGEARFRHLYTSQPDLVAARWRDYVGERAEVKLKAEAIADGWFGPVAAQAEARLGDVMVAATGNWAFITRHAKFEAGMVGMHGSITSREMRLPLFISHGSAD
jgi:hypothetical protein